MRVLHPDRGLAYLCQLLGKSRQSYYKGQKAKDDRIAFECIVSELVVELRDELENQKLGTRKLLPLIQEELDRQGLTIGRDRLFDIMDYYGLKVRRKRRRRSPQTTDNTHQYRRYPNLIKSKEVEQSEQIWVCDITYIRLKDGRFMYLSLITDMYSRKIVGYQLHESLSAEGPTRALMMAIANREYPQRTLIHHSDQGVQYCSYDYINTLKHNGMPISMASKGSPHENAMAERMNGILKQEYGLGKSIDSAEKARSMVDSAVAAYNTKRPHQMLAGQTPDQVHQHDKTMDMLETSQACEGPEVSNIPTVSSGADSVVLKPD